MNKKLPPVWIVEDDPDDQLLFRLSLQKLSLQLTFLNDGDELLPCLKTAKELPGLVLLDLNMRRMSGFQTLALIRTEPAYQDLPLVVFTTSNDPVDRQRALELGATNFFTKPTVPLEITAIVEKLLADWCADRQNY